MIKLLCPKSFLIIQNISLRLNGVSIIGKNNSFYNIHNEYIIVRFESKISCIIGSISAIVRNAFAVLGQGTSQFFAVPCNSIHNYCHKSTKLWQYYKTNQRMIIYIIHSK